ncbi:MAG TPA: phosphatase PAP2 family protein [Bryobacteraceae bacterium]|jgi:membrane-associated phospholipid phosphatase
MRPFAIAVALLCIGAGSGVLRGADSTEVDLRKLPLDVFSDQKAVWTSPARMNRNTAKWWIVIGAATAALIATDQHTITTFENAPTQLRWGNNISYVGSAYTVVPIAAGFYVVGALAHNHKATKTGYLASEALLDGLIVQEVLKPVAGRNRPNAPHEKQEWFEGGASFPSGHAIASWGVASVIAHQYGQHKWVPYVAYGLAGVVGAARFTAQQHYASDIVAGGAIGWFIGRYVVHHHDRDAQ